MMDLMLKIAAWSVAVVYIARVGRRSIREAYARGLQQGYNVACSRVHQAVMDANRMALLSEDMGDTMDARTYTGLLQESLIVSLGVHDAELRGEA